MNHPKVYGCFDPRFCLVLAMAAAMAAACNRDTSAGGVLDSSTAVEAPSSPGIVPVVLQGTVLTTGSVFGRLSSMVISNGRLWVRDRAGSPFLHVVDTSTGAVLHSLGRLGQGPGEFVDVTSLFPASDSGVWVWDYRERRLTHLEAPRSSSEPRQDPEIVQVQAIGESNMFVFGYGPEHFLAYAPRDSSAFVKMNRQGSMVESYDMQIALPEGLSKAEFRRVAGGAYPCTRPDGAGFAVAYRRFGRIDFYGPGGTVTMAAKVPAPSEPMFNRDVDTGENVFVESFPHYFSCQFTEKNLFALYNADPNAEPSGYVPIHFVHVFNMNGDLVIVLELATPATTIVVDNEANTLFAASYNDAAITKYKLPPLPDVLRREER